MEPARHPGRVRAEASGRRAGRVRRLQEIARGAPGNGRAIAGARWYTPAVIAGPPPWALARTVVAAAGLGFAAVSLGAACLDHFRESYGACDTMAASGSDAADCGAEAGADAGTGSGSGSGSAVP